MKKTDSINYVPVKMFIRFARRDNEMAERAMLVARRDDGREYVFTYEDLDENVRDLTVCDFTIKNEDDPTQTT
jgi:hypothetical protein